MTWHLAINHITSPHVTSQPTTWHLLTSQPTTWHHNASHHHHRHTAETQPATTPDGTAEGSWTKNSVWATHWLVSLRTFYFLGIVGRFRPETSAPGSPENYYKRGRSQDSQSWQMTIFVRAATWVEAVVMRNELCYQLPIIMNQKPKSKYQMMRSKTASLATFWPYRPPEAGFFFCHPARGSNSCSMFAVLTAQNEIWSLTGKRDAGKQSQNRLTWEQWSKVCLQFVPFFVAEIATQNNLVLESNHPKRPPFHRNTPIGPFFNLISSKLDPNQL